ncbi:MAG: chemotaxis protein CheW [Gemmatimonadaceae bacterium]
MSSSSETFSVAVAPPSAPLRFRDRVRARIGAADLLVFRVGGERFAIDLQAVDETVEQPQVHAVPESTSTMLGVFLHGSQFLPLYYAAKVLDVRDHRRELGAALVMRAGSRRIGLAVSDVEDVLNVEFGALRECPEGVWADEILLGLLVRERQVIGVLDARALVTACQTPPIPDAL